MSKKEVQKLIRKLESKGEFGTDACKDFDADCPHCQGHLLITLLKWYKSLLD